MCVPVESSFILYAQWVKNKEEEEKVITYGDLNNNGDIDEDDYLTLEKYLSDSSVLSSDQVISADVNGDDTVNNIDVDIIKHAYLGTSGYVGYLPYSIVPIYSLYEGDAIEGDNSSTGNGNDNSSDTNTEDNNNFDNVTEDNKDNESFSEDLSDNKTNNSSSKNPSSDTNNDNEDKESESEKREDTDKKEENKQPIIYEFKFMNENKEYSKTTCIATDSGTCELAIPTYDPVKEGYKFSGWSLDKECSNEALFTGPISVNKSNIYYACFVVDSGDKKNYSFLTVSLILIAVWGITGLTMYKIIKRFKEKNSKN